jgi:hypothetical protein
MNMAEAKSLLEEVSVVDNRKLSAELVQAWHKIIGHVDYKVAERALVLARRDAAVTYLEPKHIVAKVPYAIAELNDEQRDRESEEKGWKSEPIPVCRHHNETITKCQPCIQRLMTEGKNLYGTQLHEWAVEHLYDPTSLV